MIQSVDRVETHSLNHSVSLRRSTTSKSRQRSRRSARPETQHSEGPSSTSTSSPQRHHGPPSRPIETNYRPRCGGQ